MNQRLNADKRLDADPAHIHASPVFFRMLAEQFLACYYAYKPDTFSIVPFFLCCRVIELALKSILLEKQNQMDMKTIFKHDLENCTTSFPWKRSPLRKSRSSCCVKQTRSTRLSILNTCSPMMPAGGLAISPPSKILLA